METSVFFYSTSLSQTSGNKHQCSKLSCNTFHSEEDYSDSSELHKTARITNANVTKCACNSKRLYTPKKLRNCWIHRFVSQTFRSFSLSSSSAAVCSSTSWSRWRTALSSLELQSMLTLDSHFRWAMKSQTAGNGGQGWNKVLYGHIRTTGNQEPCGDQSDFSIKHTVHYKVLYSTCAQFHI